MFFWNSLTFSVIQWMFAVWSLLPLPFLNPPWPSGHSWFTYCWSLTWRILSITLLVCEMSQLCRSLNILWHYLSLGLEWKLMFPVLWPALCFPNFLACWMQRFHSIIFRIWNSSSGIPSPPPAFFVVMLPMALGMLPKIRYM